METKPLSCLKAVELLDHGSVVQVTGRAFVAGTLPVKVCQTATALDDSVVEWLGRRTHNLWSRVRLPIMTLPGYLFLRQVAVFGR